MPAPIESKDTTIETLLKDAGERRRALGDAALRLTTLMRQAVESDDQEAVDGPVKAVWCNGFGGQHDPHVTFFVRVDRRWDPITQERAVEVLAS